VLCINDVSVVGSSKVLWRLDDITLAYILFSIFQILASMVGIKPATFWILNVYDNYVCNLEVFGFDASKLNKF
jgi:hypothetical protein